jgi:hypothetical protein
MAKDLKPGDKVSWQTSQGKTTGKVKRRLTQPSSVKGHRADASAEDPQYLVRSDKTDAEAIHKPKALHTI